MRRKKINLNRVNIQNKKVEIDSKIKSYEKIIDKALKN